METGLLGYVYAFKHVPLWWWLIGISIVMADIIIMHPQSWNWLAARLGKDRSERFFTRTLREYTGSTNGWAVK